MTGLLITLLFVALVTTAGLWMFTRWTTPFDPAEKIGVAGLIGLGSVGLLTLAVGLLPNGLHWGFWLILAVLLVLAVLTLRSGSVQKPSIQIKGWASAALGLLILLHLLPLASVLAPSTMIDWDSLAYHLAVPKLWLTDGQIGFVRGIHHSNFPFSIDNLYIWGLWWGGESGAKAFSFAVLILGCCWAFGIARRLGAGPAAWIAPIVVTGSPVVLWEAGTAYIDHAHGIYAAIGVVYGILALNKSTAERRAEIILAGLGMGFCMGTKYTGLQAAAALAVVLAVLAGRDKVRWKNAVAVLALAGAVAAPWYIKTAVYTGSPVYPFFYSILGGNDWDEWRAEIYSHEQSTFGVPKDGTVASTPSTLGHAVLGLGYQPGRYVNPNQTQGGGFPTGAVGAGVIALLVVLAAAGTDRRWIKASLGWSAIVLLMWFVLSQQSRYLSMLVGPAAIAAAVSARRTLTTSDPTATTSATPGNNAFSNLIAAVAVGQALVTAVVLWNFPTKVYLPLATGELSPDEFRQTLVPFSAVAQRLNDDPSVTKVALYDQVFGYYLDKPYFWANPGHSLRLGYEDLVTGTDLAEALRQEEVSHVYLDFMGTTPEDRQAWQSGSLPQRTEEQRAQMDTDLNLKWRRLLEDAVREGELVPVESSGSGITFRVVD